MAQVVEDVRSIMHSTERKPRANAKLGVGSQKCVLNCTQGTAVAHCDAKEEIDELRMEVTEC